MKATKAKIRKNQRNNTIYFIRKIGDGLAKQHEELPNYSRRHLKQTH